jgi:hypothetical protein
MNHINLAGLYLFTVMFFIAGHVQAQQQLSGRVSDAASGEALQFANVWVENTNSGTTTDRNGRFVLTLPIGSHSIVVSYLGYKSVRRQITLPGVTELTITLHSVAIEMPEVTITPGDNPALRIIRKAIEMKAQQKARLRNYSLTSHSKVLMHFSGFNVSGVGSRADTGGGTVSVSGQGDSTVADTERNNLPVILETQTDAWWAAPNRYKEVVTARKQSAFIPAQTNILVSAFFITDFSSDELRIGEKAPVVGPISEAGLRSYYYSLLGTTSIDSTIIYQIGIDPLRESDPLLSGTIYIADGSYSLSMVDVRLNDAALPDLMDSVKFRQNFRLFDEGFWMPVDVIVQASARLPIVNFGLRIDALSVLQDYNINQAVDERVFDRTRIKVLQEADERDSAYWIATQKIPNTPEELRAYMVADSVKLVIDSTRYHVGWGNLLTGGVTGSEQMEFTYMGLPSLYHFNRVEGHALSGSVSLRMPELPLRNLSAEAGYGFSDARIKYQLGTSFRLFSSPALEFGASRYYQLDHIDSQGDPASRMLMTILSWVDKYDYRDFFYRDGWRSWLRYDPWLLFPMQVSFRRDAYYNAVKNSDWSVFRQNTPYRDNPPVNEGTISSVLARVSIDTRDLLDNAGQITRIGRRYHIPTFGVGMHSIDLPSRVWTVTSLHAGISGAFDFGIPGVLRYTISGDRADGDVPVQMLWNLRGGISYLTSGRGFRTLEFREFGGDTRVMTGVTYSFRDWLFRWLRLPLLRDTGWEFDVFANGGWTTMRAGSAELLTVATTEAKRPFWEAGFGVDKIFSLFRVDVAWRLNHRHAPRNFFIGLGGDYLF